MRSNGRAFKAESCDELDRERLVATLGQLCARAGWRVQDRGDRRKVIFMIDAESPGYLRFPCVAQWSPPATSSLSHTRPLKAVKADRTDGNAMELEPVFDPLPKTAQEALLRRRWWWWLAGALA